MSNKRIYTADTLPAFTRWQPTVLDDAALAPEPSPPSITTEEGLLEYLNHQEAPPELPPPSSDEPPSPPALLPGQAEALHEAAWQKGYDDGLAEGRSHGNSHAEALKELLASVNATARQLEQGLAPEILELALDFSRHILRSELTLNPKHILGLVQDMVKTLPLPVAHPKLHLHPDDADIIQQYLGAELEPIGWKILPDPSLHPGDCLIQTPQSELNGTLATRWKQLIDGLGVKKPQLMDDDETA